MPEDQNNEKLEVECLTFADELIRILKEMMII